MIKLLRSIGWVFLIFGALIGLGSFPNLNLVESFTELIPGIITIFIGVILSVIFYAIAQVLENQNKSN